MQIDGLQNEFLLSTAKVLLRTPITQMIFFNQGMLLLGSNHFLKVFSIRMGLFLSLYSVKDTENESANSVSLTLRAKGLVKIQIGSPSETTLSVYQYL